MQCSNCSQELVAGADFCGNCGAKIANAASAEQTPVQPVIDSQNTIQQPAEPPQPPVQPAETPMAAPINTAVAVPKQASSGLSIAALILGIVSLLSCLIFFVSIPLGVLAVILGAIGMRKGSKGMAIAGTILGILGIVLSIVLLVAVFNHCEKNPAEEGCEDITTAQFAQPLFKQ